MANASRELNIGQVVHGDVRAERLVFNVGGQPTELTELGDAELRAIRKGVFAALKKRLRFASLPKFFGTGLLVGFWLYLPDVMRDIPPAPGFSAMESGFIAMGVSIATVWVVVRVNFGDWQRQQQITAQILREKLAVLDAELDVRDAQAFPSIARWLRSLFESFRG